MERSSGSATWAFVRMRPSREITVPDPKAISSPPARARICTTEATNDAGVTSSGRVVVVVGGRVVVVVVVVSAAGVVATSVGMASDAAVGGGDCRRAQAVRRNTTANVVGSRRVFASRTGTG